MKNVLAVLRRAHPADSALSSVADGNAGAKARARLDAHISACTRCSARVGEYRALRARLAALAAGDAPRSFRLSPADIARPAAAPAPRAVAPGLALRAMPVLAGAAAVVFVTLVGVDLLTGNGGGTADRQFASAARSSSPPATSGAGKALVPGPALAATPEAAGALSDSAAAPTPAPGLTYESASGTPSAAVAAPRSAGTSLAQPPSTSTAGSELTSRNAATPPAGVPSAGAATQPAGKSGDGIGAMRWAEAAAAAVALLAGSAGVVLWRRREEGS